MTIRTRLSVASVAAAVALFMTVFVVSALGVAQATTGHSTPKPTVKAAKVASVHRTLLVNAGGRTLYVLSPETARHLLCTGSACLGAWPPLLVAAHTKPVAGKGVSGKLGTIKRGKKLQVTLRGHPLYTFAGDAAKGQVNGEGVVSFGGTWHAVDAEPAASAPPAMPAPSLPGY